MYPLRTNFISDLVVLDTKTVFASVNNIVSGVSDYNFPFSQQGKKFPWNPNVVRCTPYPLQILGSLFKTQWPWQQVGW